MEKTTPGWGGFPYFRAHVAEKAFSLLSVSSVAAKHRGYWFYIDETDVHTKLFYVILRTLWSVSIAAASDQSAAPVLTIPVSR